MNNLAELTQSIFTSQELNALEKDYAYNFLMTLKGVEELNQIIANEIVSEKLLTQYIADDTDLINNNYWLTLMNGLKIELVRINESDYQFKLNNNLLTFSQLNDLIEPLIFDEQFFIKHRN